MPIVKSELKIVPYDPRWPNAFAAEAVRLRNALGPLALRIDHNGSTSIPGLAAKAIIDIQISVAVLQPHHVHVVQNGGAEERRTLTFRDYLREHGALAREYEQLKRDLATQLAPSDRESHEAYARAKTDFIDRIVAIALRRGYPRAGKLPDVQMSRISGEAPKVRNK